MAIEGNPPWLTPWEGPLEVIYCIDEKNHRTIAATASCYKRLFAGTFRNELKRGKWNDQSLMEVDQDPDFPTTCEDLIELGMRVTNESVVYSVK